ncbi:MAG: acyl-CoA desaturase [Gammaproteobacteria bacterium]|nr:MAG: acyl-CoA desaturase [Gammaproteobacteria bacterium]
MYYGLFPLSVWGYVAIALAFTHLTILGVTLYLHRCQSHRSLSLHPAVSHLFRFWLWLTTGMRTKEWVAIHRKHHVKCETPDDPHSPQVLGLKKVLWQGAELYRRAAADEQTLRRYGKGTPDDWLERNLYGHRIRGDWGVALMLLIDLACFGVVGLTIWAVQMAWIPFWAAGVINGLGHYWGYRNFETKDAATNLLPWGILVGGEELHNNHHAYPYSAKMSNRWWEFDLGWFWLRLLARFRLARVRRVAPRVRLEPERFRIDADTLQAVVRNRFHILKLYARTVVLPVIRRESRQAAPQQRSLLRRCRRWLSREDIRLDSTARERLQEALASSAALATVYRLREQLKTLWQVHGELPEQRLARLREWCHEAEQSGIEALREFSALLRSYTLQAHPLAA